VLSIDTLVKGSFQSELPVNRQPDENCAKAIQNLVQESRATHCMEELKGNTFPNSSLQDIEKELLNFIFELREQGIPVQIFCSSGQSKRFDATFINQGPDWLNIKWWQDGLSGIVLCTEWVPMRAKEHLQKQQLWPLIT
jgi:hypothetical protein